MGETDQQDAKSAPAQEITVKIGQGRVLVRVESPSDVQIHFDLQTENEEGLPTASRSLLYGPPISSKPSYRQQLAGFWAWVKARVSAPVFLLWAGAAVYLATRLIALPEYPIYFFTDEAAQTTLAADLVRDGFRAGGELFPVFFKNAYQYNLGVSVYLQVIPYLLFGKSIWVTRGVAALTTVIAAVALGLAMKRVFRSPYPWTAVLVLSITPAWLLHSRTAFETGIATAFYAAFLYCYLLYLREKPTALYPAIIFGALAFYSYSPARMVVLVTAALFFLSDLKYHRQQRRVVLRGLGLALLVALPFLRFQINHPQENLHHLEVLNSYWIRSIPLSEKVGIYFKQYLRGLDPFYWYLGRNNDLPRHLMDSYGHLLRTSLPFGVAGLWMAIRRVRQAPYRTLLLALLAAPSGAALVEVGITRILILVVPAALLTALGLSAALEWIKDRWQLSRAALSLPVFALLAGFNFWMLQDALVNGPLWHTNYGLAGMQWGAKQIFGEIQKISTGQPGTSISLSPSWANGTDAIAQFFFDDPMPFQIESIEGYFDRRRTLDKSRVFIMIPEEYKKVLNSPKFTGIQVDQIMLFPNGQPGFYFVRLEYAPNIDALLEEESAKRRILQEERITIDGQPAVVKYSYLDMGPVDKIFDGDERSLIRTFEANPFKLEVIFNQPRILHMLSVRIGGTATDFSYKLLDAKENLLSAGELSVKEEPNPRWLEFPIDPPQTAEQVIIEVKNRNDKEPAHVHLWEVKFK